MADTPNRAAGPCGNAHAASARWDALLAGYEAVEAGDTTDETIEAAGNLAAELMAMPSPHAAALRWKLDFLLADQGNGGTAPWSCDFAAQAVADYRRMLGEA